MYRSGTGENSNQGLDQGPIKETGIQPSQVCPTKSQSLVNESVAQSLVNKTVAQSLVSMMDQGSDKKTMFWLTGLWICARSIDGHPQNSWHSHRIESGFSTLRSLKWFADDRHMKCERDKTFYKRLQPIPREALTTDPQKAETL